MQAIYILVWGVTLAIHANLAHRSISTGCKIRAAADSHESLSLKHVRFAGHM